MDTLIDEEEFQAEYNGGWDKAWKYYVDKQNMGDYQGIVSSVIRNFPQVIKYFSEIEDESYTDDDDNEQTLMTHHWVEINNTIYAFLKGTLVDYIEWSDICGVSTENDK
jgi:hypothetical protein